MQRTVITLYRIPTQYSKCILKIVFSCIYLTNETLYINCILKVNYIDKSAGITINYKYFEVHNICTKNIIMA